jgi:hypothetical protein
MSMIALVAILVISVHNGGFAGEKELTIIDTLGRSTTGELLAVRPDELILTLKAGATEKELQQHPEFLYRVPRQTIAVIEIQGHSYVWIGVGIGAVAGMAAGVAIGAASVEEEKDPVARIFIQPMTTGLGAAAGGLLGLVGGGLIGGLLGGAASSGDRHVGPDNADATLRPLARYPGAEPEFLKNLPYAGP